MLSEATVSLELYEAERHREAGGIESDDAKEVVVNREYGSDGTKTVALINCLPGIIFIRSDAGILAGNSSRFGGKRSGTYTAGKGQYSFALDGGYHSMKSAGPLASTGDGAYSFVVCLRRMTIDH